MSNSKFFQLPGGDVAVSVVPVDPATGRAVVESSRRVRIIGKCSDLDNVLRDTWDGPTPLYVFPSAPMQMQVVSSSANDTAAGAGVRSVEIQYLDGNYVEHSVTLELNGVTPVLTPASDMFRINKMQAAAVGANGISSGAITLSAIGGGTPYSIIPIGRTFARQAIYTVPEGYVFEIEQWQISSGSTGAHFCQHTLVATSDDGVLTTVFHPKDEQGTQNGGVVINYPFNFESIPARADVKVGIISDGVSANVIALTAILGKLRQL